MSRKLLLSGISPEVVAWHDALPDGTRSATVDAIVRGYLALPEAERAAFRRPAPLPPGTLTPERARDLVAEHGSATAAARAIGVATSTITRATKKS